MINFIKEKNSLRIDCTFYPDYWDKQEREQYEYIIVEGQVIHKQTGDLLDTQGEATGSKWIFVMSTSEKLYAGKVR